jgi:hypothetical protein
MTDDLRRFLGSMAVAAMCCSAVSGTTELNVSVRDIISDSNTVDVHAGGTVEYKVDGWLTGDPNGGLALVLLDLSFDGGDLPQADTPTEDPMKNFANEDPDHLGITNPAGYGGTVINGDLIQMCGAQNTINNVEENAPFPLGSVITGVAQSEVTLVTGSVDIPDDLTPGAYQLSLSNLAASVIREGETGDPFWATELAGTGTIASLTVKPWAWPCLPRVRWLSLGAGWPNRCERPNPHSMVSNRSRST